MTIQKQEVHVTSPSGEPRGIEVTEETFEPLGLVFAVGGELDIATAPALRDRLDAAIKAGKLSLVIDLYGGRLPRLRRARDDRARAQGAARGGQARAGRRARLLPMLIFESSGLNKMLDLVETREQAIALVSG